MYNFTRAYELAFIAAQSILSLLSPSNSLNVCKTVPGDIAWPSAVLWDAFNLTIDGRLIRTSPIGSPCHKLSYDADQCTFVQKNWNDPRLHIESSSSVMTPFFANNSCNPFSDPDEPCIIGTYVQYAVNVSTPSHIIKTLNFAREHNIRFVVRNTGHDYMGKSTGAGALAIWTLHLKDTEWTENYSSIAYNGPAVKAAAGVSVEQLYYEADKHKLIVVGGQCPTVGFTGGYIQGGGHSLFSSIYGLAADQTLSFEVITAEGALVTASPAENSDLYWALSGGGGGTYGVVWSVTVKVHPDTPATAVTISFTTGSNVTLDTWWDAVNFYHASTPNYTAAGAFALAYYFPGDFQLRNLFVPNATADHVSTLVHPFLEKLDILRIPYKFTITTHPGHLSVYKNVYGKGVMPVGLNQFGGRLLPARLWEDERAFKKMTKVIRDIVNDGSEIFDVAIRPKMGAHNAVLPAWRDSERLFIPMRHWDDRASWDNVLADRRKLTWKYGQALRLLAPESGAYLNEADASEPNWQIAFYGDNYKKLLAIKDKWDPDQMLYGTTAVGGDRWEERDDGRLCPV